MNISLVWITWGEITFNKCNSKVVLSVGGPCCHLNQHKLVEVLCWRIKQSKICCTNTHDLLQKRLFVDLVDCHCPWNAPYGWLCRIPLRQCLCGLRCLVSLHQCPQGSHPVTSKIHICVWNGEFTSQRSNDSTHTVILQLKWKWRF